NGETLGPLRLGVVIKVVNLRTEDVNHQDDGRGDAAHHKAVLHRRRARLVPGQPLDQRHPSILSGSLPYPSTSFASGRAFLSTISDISDMCAEVRGGRGSRRVERLRRGKIVSDKFGAADFEERRSSMTTIRRWARGAIGAAALSLAGC